MHFLGGYTEVYGIPLATPGIVEKGYLDTKLEIAAPGGHSSIPPSHTVSAFLVPTAFKLKELLEYRYARRVTD